MLRVSACFCVCVQGMLPSDRGPGALRKPTMADALERMAAAAAAADAHDSSVSRPSTAGTTLPTLAASSQRKLPALAAPDTTAVVATGSDSAAGILRGLSPLWGPDSVMMLRGLDTPAPVPFIPEVRP